MASCELDHIVIGAATLEDGVRFVRERLGVDLPPGGKHPLMGTHNHLMRLGPSSFLEVIAIDAEAPPPTRARWYGLDDAAQSARLREEPGLIAWVVRTDDVVAVAEAASLGDVLAVTRGDLSWRLTVPADGLPQEGGTVPHAIQWDRGLRPWEAMADLGCSLDALELGHPDPKMLEKRLQAIGADGLPVIRIVEGAQRRLSVLIRTPSGPVRI